jgi:hypothetical protein
MGALTLCAESLCPLRCGRVSDRSAQPKHRPLKVADAQISPLDVKDADQMAWLETLVWPEQADRLARLRAAVRVARADPPRIVQGDLTRDLTLIVKEAPLDATLVVFHTAVLAYVADQDERDAFATQALSLCDYWISNEAPSVFPSIAAKTDRELRPPLFMLAVNGQPVAAAHPHGATLDWIAEPPPANRRRESAE